MLPVTNDAVTLTREELYEMVWSELLWTLAQRYGLSDVGLAKTCRRFKIPVPWRGYSSPHIASRRFHRKSSGRIGSSNRCLPFVRCASSSGYHPGKYGVSR